MAMTKKCVQALLDLVENKLSNIQVQDREDAREAATLEACKRELTAIMERVPARTAPRAQAA